MTATTVSKFPAKPLLMNMCQIVQRYETGVKTDCASKTYDCLANTWKHRQWNHWLKRFYIGERQCFYTLLKVNYEAWLCAQADEKRDHVEVCAEAGVILEHLAARLEEDGGLALFADYGHDGTKTDTFRVRFITYCKALNYFSVLFLIRGFKYIYIWTCHPDRSSYLTLRRWNFLLNFSTPCI